MHRLASMSRPGRAGDLTTILVAAWAIVGVTTVKAQDYVSRPSSFEAVNYPSLENQILDRLAETTQYQPEDLPRLARLVVLESIAMLVDVRTDLAETTIGNRLWDEITALSEASERLYESVRSPPLGEADLVRSQRLYEVVEANYRRVDSSLGEFPGLSNQAAAHLRRVTRLVAVIGSLIRALESSLATTTPARAGRSSDLDSLQRQAHALTNGLVELIVKVSDPRRKRSGREGVLRGLDELLEYVQSFEQTVSLQRPDNNPEASLHAVRRRFWRVEAAMIPLDWPTELTNGWRTVRERLNAISDDFGMPRVIVLGPTGPAVARPGSVGLERPIARIYRGAPGVR